MFGHFYGSTCLAGAILVGSGRLASFAAGEDGLSADQVIERAAARSQDTEARAGKARYTYTKLTVTEELDAAGRVKERKERVYRVYFENGATHLRLLTVNGRPPGDAEIKKQMENETAARQVRGTSRDRKRENENLLTPEVVARFQFTLRDRVSVNGRQAYEVGFEPKRPGPPAHGPLERLLSRLSGTLWIDAEEFEIARVEVSLGSEIDFLGGIVGSLKKLAFTMFERESLTACGSIHLRQAISKGASCSTRCGLRPNPSPGIFVLYSARELNQRGYAFRSILEVVFT